MRQTTVQTNNIAPTVLSSMEPVAEYTYSITFNVSPIVCTEHYPVDVGHSWGRVSQLSGCGCSSTRTTHTLESNTKLPGIQICVWKRRHIKLFFSIFQQARDPPTSLRIMYTWVLLTINGPCKNKHHHTSQDQGTTPVPIKRHLSFLPSLAPLASFCYRHA